MTKWKNEHSFGAPPSAPSSSICALFGAMPAPPVSGETSAAPNSLGGFGGGPGFAASSGGFGFPSATSVALGLPAPAPSCFGTTSAPSSLFGAAPAPSLFGETSAAPHSIGGFGGDHGFSTTSGGFGAPLATSGGFGFEMQPFLSAFGAPSATSGGFGFGTQPAPAPHESAGFGTASSFGFPPATKTGFTPPAFGSNGFSFASIQAAAAAPTSNFVPFGSHSSFRAPINRNNPVVPTSKTGGGDSVLVGHLAQEIVDRINKLEYNDWKEKVFGYFSRKSIQAQSDSNMMDEDFGDKLLALLKHLEVLAKISVLKLVVWKAKCRLHSSDENSNPLGAVMWSSKGWKKVKQHYVDDAAIETVAKLIRPWLEE
ncbi:hypothetical protein MPSEU_000860300 [Mayamaea pseudoterrestris]|nr:hypothetical protein MPSEU_000860300 [Mayamaea pseudoterrestris]